MSVDPFASADEEWFTLESISPAPENKERLYCIEVDAPEKQFLAGNIRVPTHNTEEGKEQDKLKGEASMVIGSIARLGRAAGVHLVIATQRPDASLIPGETKANLGVRVNCGRTDANASSMILGTPEGTRVRANPRGRLYLRIYGAGDHGQGFYAEPDWIDNWLASQGKNPDGTSLSTKQSRLAKIADMDQFEGTDLDAREGVNNAAAIEKIREEEADGAFEAFTPDSTFEEDDAWDFEGPADSPQETSSDDFTFELEEDEDEASNEDTPGDQVPGSLDRPRLADTSANKDQWHRPVDDWDLDDLIEENFS